jgi:hypothetical protein
LLRANHSVHRDQENTVPIDYRASGRLLKTLVCPLASDFSDGDGFASMPPVVFG